jgi:1,4-dihydroxy-2-naphthoyl-CoA hydrolase
MSIWFKKDFTLDDLQDVGVVGLSKFLQMEWREIGESHLKMSMPVAENTKQPYGLLHGGASCALAETVGSVASALVVDRSKFSCVGLEINANHIRAIRSGKVTATCTPLHLGGSTHVWDIKLHDDEGKLTCVSRLTVAIIAKDMIK